jgi:uncharacterized membrane protein YhaH (DUF805 family)
MIKKGLMIARRLIDPSTKQACAFYAGIACALMDVRQRGFYIWNVIFLASLCGVTVAGLLSMLIGKNMERVETEPAKVETPQA